MSRVVVVTFSFYYVRTHHCAALALYLSSSVLRCTKARETQARTLTTQLHKENTNYFSYLSSQALCACKCVRDGQMLSTEMSGA